MLSHVLVRPLRLRGRTSLLSASITSSRTRTNTHTDTHTVHTLCRHSQPCPIQYMLHVCTQSNLRVFPLATCPWRYLCLALLHIHMHTHTHAHTHIHTHSHTLPRGPCDLPCLPHPAPVRVKCQLSRATSPRAASPLRAGSELLYWASKKSLCQRSQHHRRPSPTSLAKAAPPAFTRIIYIFPSAEEDEALGERRRCL